ncbi:hypothetical protein OIU84_004367 [Salix udensis]|uniref:Gamma-glutamylcyclotransferase AIG2-like domain-containing protein n=1 Tax=Salix udensis TaxID=889485 RepID=A0AAD6K426_9ROSI|nr:hypothetical protein OIU84_004367 [Salix udensis]
MADAKNVSNETKQTLVFVYGTLKKDFPNHHLVQQLISPKRSHIRRHLHNPPTTPSRYWPLWDPLHAVPPWWRGSPKSMASYTP